MVEREWFRDAESDLDDRDTCMAELGGNDLAEDNIEEEAKELEMLESNGVDSEGGGSPVLVLASRLQTGQKVLQAVSQESTQEA